MALTDAQHEMLVALDEAAEHIAWEFDADEYEGFSTCGFAHIGNIDGRSSFVQRIRSLAREHECVHVEEKNKHSGNEFKIDVGGLEAVLQPSYDSGYQLSITNIGQYIDGPEYQRMDVRERLNGLLRCGFERNGYLTEARVKSRMD
jgi:hypothetical protein